MRRDLGKAALAGLLAGAACTALTTSFKIGAADFAWALRAARDLLGGRDPYAYTPGPDAIPYPLPAALVALPLSRLPDSIAAGIFIGFSVALLAWGTFRAKESWRLGLLFSWPFIYSAIFVQWSPLFCGIWFTPALAPFILAKPNIGLPLVIAAAVRTWRSVLPPLLVRQWIAALAVSVLVLAASLWIYPTWLIVWMRQTATYQGSVPPLFYLPFGPLILLSLIRWRDERAWLILSMALMPQRMIYDQLALLLVARTSKEMFPLIAATWAGFLGLWLSKDMARMAGSWHLMVLLAHYLPAVVVLIAPDVKNWFRKASPEFSAT